MEILLVSHINITLRNLLLFPIGTYMSVFLILSHALPVLLDLNQVLRFKNAALATYF